MKLDSKRCFNDAYFLLKKLVCNLLIACHVPMILLKTVGKTEKLFKLPALKKHVFIEEP